MSGKNKVLEARREDLNYKTKYVKGLIDRVVVELRGTESAVLSRLARQIVRIDRLIKKLNTQKKTIHDELKERVSDLFDAEDEVITRVAETVSFILTLDRRTEPSKTEKVDYEKAFLELYEIMPELTDKLNEVLRKYTTVREIAPKTPGLRIKVKEGKMEDFWTKLKQYVKLFKEKIQAWGSQYDRKLEDIKKNLG